MSVSRRNALSMLGIGTGAIVSGEALAVPAKEIPGSFGSAGYSFGINRDSTAAALRRLADDIDKRGTYPQAMVLSSKVGLEDFLEHTLTITFILDELSRPAA